MLLPAKGNKLSDGCWPICSDETLPNPDLPLVSFQGISWRKDKQQLNHSCRNNKGHLNLFGWMSCSGRPRLWWWLLNSLCALSSPCGTSSLCSHPGTHCFRGPSAHTEPSPAWVLTGLQHYPFFTGSLIPSTHPNPSFKRRRLLVQQSP